MYKFSKNNTYYIGEWSNKKMFYIGAYIYNTSYGYKISIGEFNNGKKDKDFIRL